MKVLCLENYQGDLGGSFFFHGLKQVLGEDNVIEYPRKACFHGEVDRRPCHDGRDIEVVTAPFPWMPAYKDIKLSEDEVVQRVAEKYFDFLVVTERGESQEAMQMLQGRFNPIPIPVIFCENEDYHHVRYDLINQFQPVVSFKRELATDTYRKDDSPRIYPLPFSFPADRAPDLSGVEVEYDIVFLLGLTHWLRQYVWEKVSGWRRRYRIYAALGGKDPGSDDHFLCWEDYLRKMASARVAVSIRGGGQDTARYWEIPATGSLMLSGALTTIHPHPFRDGEQVVFFDNEDDFVTKIEHYLEHEDERKAIAAAGKKHLLDHHTCKARAEWFLEKVKAVI